MYRRILSLLALATLPAAALAAPDDQPVTGERAPAGTSESASQPSGQGANSGQAGPEAQAGTTEESSLNLMATDELIGRDVVTREGEHIGTLQFVTVSLDQGSVSHLIVDTSDTDFAPGGGPQPNRNEPGASPGQPAPAEGDGTTQADATAQAGDAQQREQQQNGNLLIVPWSVAKVDAAASGIVVAATGRHIDNAPRLQRQELNRLTEPAVASYVVDYWAPASELAALEGRRQPSQSQQQEPQGSQGSGVEKNHQGQNDATRSKEQSSPDQASVEKQSQPSSSEQALAERSESAPMNRLSQSDSPAAANAKKDDQTAVRDQQGQQTAGTAQAGATAQADSSQQRGPAQPAPGQQGPVTTNTGQVVLVGQEVVTAVTPPMFQLSKQLRGAQVVDQSGNDIGEIRQIMIDTRTGDAAFAIIEGSSPGRAPVPLPALTWSAEGTTMLTAETSSLRSNSTLTERPSEATRQDLAQLYQRFGAEPYWERGGRSGQSGSRSTPQDSSGQVPQ